MILPRLQEPRDRYRHSAPGVTAYVVFKGNISARLVKANAFTYELANQGASLAIPTVLQLLLAGPGG